VIYCHGVYAASIRRDEGVAGANCIIQVRDIMFYELLRSNINVSRDHANSHCEYDYRMLMCTGAWIYEYCVTQLKFRLFELDKLQSIHIQR
jgi:hypothetical protein